MAEKGKTDEKNICTSIFRNGGDRTTKEAYTQKWVELINALERRKQGHE